MQGRDDDFWKAVFTNAGPEENAEPIARSRATPSRMKTRPNLKQAS